MPKRLQTEFCKIGNKSKGEKMEKERNITKILAIAYLLIITWIIVFKMQFSMENLPEMRNINLVPFGESVIVNGKIDFDEIIDNVIVFIPLGLYLNMLKKDWKISRKIGVLAGISLLFEMLQYILAIGATDITDLINNTLGGIVGLGVYTLFYKGLKTEKKTNQILNILGRNWNDFGDIAYGYIDYG